MRLNPSHNLALKQAEGRVLVKFAIELAKIQLAGKRHFLMENPGPSEAWKLPEMIKFLEEHFIHVARFDQCRFGLRSPGSQQPIRKRTRLLHNVPQLCQAFGGAFCQCTVPHRRIEGSENGVQLSSFCETYPPLMVETMLAAIRAEVSVEFIN
jgi:hypothetical protein